MPDDDSAATIFDVAREAGVSITTVSHVFSGKRPVSVGTAERVHEVARRIAYRPPVTARTLGVQFPFSSPEVLVNPFFAGLLPSMSETMIGLGYSLVLVPPDPPEATFLRPLVDRRAIDGAILLDPARGDAFPRALHDAGLPFVSLGRVPGVPGVRRVDQDFAGALAAIAAHLREGGYGRPALIMLPGAVTTQEDIREAFLASVPGGPVAVTPDHGDGAAEETAGALLDGADRPDAIVCLTERQAAGTYRAAAARGISVPRDLGVLALGESGIGRGMRPPLTALSLFPERSGVRLVHLVHDVLSGRSGLPEVSLVETELLPRESTAGRR